MSQRHQPPQEMPHSHDTEKAILGSMLLDNEAIPGVMEVLRQEDFYTESHKVLYAAMIEEYTSSGLLDMELLMERLKRTSKLEEVGGYVAIASLEVNVFSTGAAHGQALLVAEKSRARKLIRACTEMASQVMAEDAPVDEQLEEASRRIYEISQDSRQNTIQSLGDLWMPTLKGIQAAKDGAPDGVRLGWVDIDNRFVMTPTSLTILAARPSIGKTALGLNVAYNQAMKGGRVLIFSMEMGEEELTKRLISRHAGIPIPSDPKYLSPWHLKQMMDMEEQARALPIDIEATPGLSLLQLCAKARRWALQHRDASLIIVDHIGLMDVQHRKGASKNDELGELSRGFKRLAMELHIPVMALCQLNRNIEHRSTKDRHAKPKLSDLRESGRIEEDADNVMFIHRERVKETPGVKLPPIATDIIVEKQRNGALFQATLMFDMSTGTFFNAATQSAE